MINTVIRLSNVHRTYHSILLILTAVSSTSPSKVFTLHWLTVPNGHFPESRFHKEFNELFGELRQRFLTCLKKSENFYTITYLSQIIFNWYIHILITTAWVPTAQHSPKKPVLSLLIIEACSRSVNWLLIYFLLIRIILRFLFLTQFLSARDDIWSDSVISGTNGNDIN